MGLYAKWVTAWRRPPFLLGVLWGALNWLVNYGTAHRWVPGAMEYAGSWVRGLPVAQGVEHLFMWPTRVSAHLVAMLGFSPYSRFPIEIPRFELLPWVWPLAILTSVAAVCLLDVLLTATSPRRWLVGVLVGMVAIPGFHQAYAIGKIQGRLFPAHPFHHSTFTGAGHLRYSDLAQGARERITEAEFNNWRTWADVAASFDKAPVNGGGIIWSAWHFHSSEPSRGDELGIFTFEPMTGKLKNVSFKYWGETPDVTLTSGGYNSGVVTAKVKNWRDRPVRIVSLSVGSPVRILPLDLRLTPGEETELSIEIDTKEIGAKFQLSWETEIETYSHMYQLFGP